MTVTTPRSIGSPNTAVTLARAPIRSAMASRNRSAGPPSAARRASSIASACVAVICLPPKFDRDRDCAGTLNMEG
jgi:hypothetical protein